MVKKRLWQIIFIMLILIFFLYQANKLTHLNRSSIEYCEDYTKTMAWLGENSDESSIVLTDWTYGPNVATFAKRGTVTTTKVYPSEIKFVAERYKDASKFFFASSEDDAMNIVRKYSITHMLIPRHHSLYKKCKYIQACGVKEPAGYQSVSDKSLISDTRKGFIVTRMQDGDMFYNFEKVYDSKFFTIYKVVKPKNWQDDGLPEYEDVIKGSFKNAQNSKKYSDVFGIIIPHHLAYSYQITADMFNSLKGNYDTIIILGPDHFSSSKTKVSTSYLDWETSFGRLSPDTGVIKELNLKADEQAHTNEHSVRSILPFVKYKFPDAKVVPIILNKSVSEQEAIDLGKNISRFENTLIIASVDFSHDTNLDAALEQDALAIETIKHFKMENVYSLNIDSKPSLLALLTAMSYKGAKQAELLNYTNSGQLTKDYPKNVGYVSMVFQK